MALTVEQRRTALADMLAGNAGEAALAERARMSSLSFVRSHAQLAFHTEAARGWKLTAFESVQAFGRDTLAMLLERNNAVIVHRGCVVAPVVRARREALGVGTASLAAAAGLPEPVVLEVEAGRRTMPIGQMRSLARALALDAVRLGSIPEEEASFAVRGLFREEAPTGRQIEQGDVLVLAAAASLAFSEVRLAGWLGRGLLRPALTIPRRPPTDVPSGWAEGAALATETRKLLSLGPSEPIASLAVLIEGRLGIPVVRVEIAGQIAGATLSDGRLRGIALNVSGINSRPGARRVSLGHELCHVLWDGDEAMRGIRIEPDISRAAADPAAKGPIEARAQAFGSELTAPAAAAAQVSLANGSAEAGIAAVMDRFGVSRACAARQIANGLGREPDWSVARAVPPERTSTRWRASELLPPSQVELPRAGHPMTERIFRLCAEAVAANLITDDTAAHVMAVDPGAMSEALLLREDGPRLG